MPIRAVLFDFGGTLYDYACFAAAEAESMAELVQWAGIEASVPEIVAAYRDSMREAFRSYLPRSYYLHRDLFADAAAGMVRRLGANVDATLLERNRVAQWQRHRRDFTLRPGVKETLTELRRRGIHVGMVSNIDDDQLEHLLDVAGIIELFDAIVSSEQAQSCKPDMRIYQRALEQAGCTAEEALFVGDTLRQDVAGANRMGLRSVLLWHRDDLPPPDGDLRPNHVIREIPEVLTLLDA